MGHKLFFPIFRRNARWIKSERKAGGAARLPRSLGHTVSIANGIADVILIDMDNNSNTSDEAMGAQTTSAELDSDQVHDAAEQLQASVSHFGQEDEKRQQSLRTVMKQMSAQLRTTDAKVQGNRAEIDKLANRIRNYRS